MKESQLSVFEDPNCQMLSLSISQLYAVVLHVPNSLTAATDVDSGFITGQNSRTFLFRLIPNTAVISHYTI